MSAELLIKKTGSQSLDSFVAALPNIIGLDRFEERHSTNCPPDERYFRRIVLGLEITVCVADEAEFQDYDFSVWLKPVTSHTREKSLLDGLADCVARQFAVCGYEVLRPHDVIHRGGGGTIYRLNPTTGVTPRDRVLTEEI
jgi:hypothetical protein